MRQASELVTPHIQCLLYATYWVRPILSELLGAAQELSGPNKNRAPSGPVKAVVSPTPHSRVVSGVTVVSRISALISLPTGQCWLLSECPEGLIQSVRSTPPPQSDEASGETAGARTDGNLLAVRFADNRAPGTTWDIDTEYAQRNSFSATIEGYSNNLIQPAVMLSFVPMGATRVVLEIITPSENGITAERWRKDAAVCPSNWPTDYSLLRAWYLQGSLYQFALSQYKKIGHRRMFAECTLDLETLASRVFFPRPANYLSQVAINQQWANFDFPNKESQET